MELPHCVRPNADLQTAALCHRIYQIGNNPAGAFIVGRVGVVRESFRQGINHHPGYVGVLFTTRNETFRRIVIAVISNASSAQHYIRLQLS